VTPATASVVLRRVAKRTATSSKRTAAFGIVSARWGAGAVTLLGDRCVPVRVGLARILDIVIAKVQHNAGLTLSRRLCQYALDSGVPLMGSGLTDSDVGLAASTHLFAAFGIDTPVYLNGRQFLQSCYTYETVSTTSGIATVSNLPGLGVVVDQEWVTAHRPVVSPS
jgi:hypothetical protein